MQKTQQQIAELVGVTQPMISDILSGKKRPSPATAKALEQATGVGRLSWLYPDEYPNPLLKANHVNTPDA